MNAGRLSQLPKYFPSVFPSETLLSDQKLEFLNLVVLQLFLIADILCASLTGCQQVSKVKG
jgi:hypothetical protein